jgi:hypothetical protein
MIIMAHVVFSYHKSTFPIPQKPTFVFFFGGFRFRIIILHIKNRHIPYVGGTGNPAFGNKKD